MYISVLDVKNHKLAHMPFFINFYLRARETCSIEEEQSRVIFKKAKLTSVHELYALSVESNDCICIKDLIRLASTS
jgi:hypothetical protein